MYVCSKYTTSVSSKTALFAFRVDDISQNFNVFQYSKVVYDSVRPFCKQLFLQFKETIRRGKFLLLWSQNPLLTYEKI